MKSLSEIETITKRSSRAVGFSWGEAEEVGKCVRELELLGFAGIKSLNLYYQKKKNVNFEELNLVSKTNKPKKYPFCPISVGISFLDQIKKIENIKKCTFENIAFPILLLPFISRGSEIIGKKILLKFDEFKFLLNFSLNISTNFFDRDLPQKAKNIEISFLENIDNFSDKDWKYLYKLSEETFVEESDSLKKDAAGAGLTDND